MIKRRPAPGLSAAALLWLALAAPAAATALEPFSADYLASYMGLQGNGRMTLTRDSGDRWTYSLTIRSSVAQLTQSTVFEDDAGRWRPLSNSDASLLLIKKVRKQATYDWQRGVATWSGDVKPERAGPIKLQAGDLDAMLVNLAVARDLAAGRPLRYRMVDDGRVKQLIYSVAGKEKITIAGQSHEATKVIGTDGNKQTIAWIVEGLPVPARILRRKDGRDEMDLRLKSLP
jgi:hypothetical protein